jgi:hypothetical protein
MFNYVDMLFTLPILLFEQSQVNKGKRNWNKEKDKFNKKLNSIFFVIYLTKKDIYIYIYIWRKIEILLITLKNTFKWPQLNC